MKVKEASLAVKTESDREPKTLPHSKNVARYQRRGNAMLMTDGFHLVVEALKLNGVDTIRDCRVSDAEAGICITVSAPGFLNGMVALANATTNCFPMILISRSSDPAIVDLEQGDYKELDQMKRRQALCECRLLHQLAARHRLCAGAPQQGRESLTS